MALFKISMGNKHFINSYIKFVYILLENLQRTKFKSSCLMNLGKETSWHLNVQFVTWIFLHSFSQIYSENSGQNIDTNDL